MGLDVLREGLRVCEDSMGTPYGFDGDSMEDRQMPLRAACSVESNEHRLAMDARKGAG